MLTFGDSGAVVYLVLDERRRSTSCSSNGSADPLQRPAVRSSCVEVRCLFTLGVEPQVWCRLLHRCSLSCFRPSRPAHPFRPRGDAKLIATEASVLIALVKRVAPTATVLERIITAVEVGDEQAAPPTSSALSRGRPRTLPLAAPLPMVLRDLSGSRGFRSRTCSRPPIPSAGCRARGCRRRL